MPKDHTTSHYEVLVHFKIVERNSYGDQLSDSALSFTKKISVKSLAGLGQMFEKIDNTLGESS